MVRARKQQTRSETEVFKDLCELTSRPGFIHALAFLSYKHNIITFEVDKGLTSDDLSKMYLPNRLIRTEMTTLLGMMAKEEINFSIISNEVAKEYAKNAEDLLEELHGTFMADFAVSFDSAVEKKRPWFNGKMMQEAIFYGADSAYDFQYRDLAPIRYEKDRDWILEKMGFSIDEAIRITQLIRVLKEIKLNEAMITHGKKAIAEDKCLPFFKFNVSEIATSLQLDEQVVKSFVQALALRDGNKGFSCVGDFNEATARPIVRINDDDFYVFNTYDLLEALYDSPFYWMIGDDSYKGKASKNRGEFTEQFCAERLSSVFGPERVFLNITIKNGNDILGEIDVLVIHGDRAIVLQAKNKRLTLESRKGNDKVIKDDFKKSVQDSYDQGLLCSKHILEKESLTFLQASGEEIEIPKIEEIYPICVVSDHYPSLSTQVREFLKYEKSQEIFPPYVMDVFTLDVIAEMLNTPLHLMSYIQRRVGYLDSVLATHELTLLSDHIKRNLWVDSQYDMVFLGEDISSDLDVAMSVRRNGIPGNGTPDGILTRIKVGILGSILESIEKNPKPAEIDLGYFILMLGGEAFDNTNRLLEKMVSATLADSQNHDVTIPIQERQLGITFHCNFDPDDVALPRLRSHCERRKYTHKANKWVGVLLDPTTKTIKRVLMLKGTWVFCQALQIETAHLKEYSSVGKILNKGAARNASCPCGSGKKYKRCCGLA